MELSKLEKAINVGTILNAINNDKLQEYVDLDKLPSLVKVINKMNKRTTPEEKEKAITSLVNKLVDDFLKEINQEEIKQSPPLKK
ncbi:hypothetical protein COD66_23350 [Bacillus cereus]|nr:hypothetical protein COD66_23350 [Bacillus cereus]